MQTICTVQKLVHEQVTDILKVRVSFLHKFSYRVKFRTLSTMYEKCSKLILYKCISLYSTVTLHLLSAKQCDIIQLPGDKVSSSTYKSCHSSRGRHRVASYGGGGGGGEAGSTELNYHNPISSLHQSVYVIIEHARNLGEGRAS